MGGARRGEAAAGARTRLNDGRFEGTVEPEAAGSRLDTWLARHVPGESRARLQRLIEEGHVTVGGRAARPSAKLRAGSTVQVAFPAPTPLEVAAEPLPLAIVYQDERLLVLDKPPGLVVHPGAGHASGTLVNALLHHVKDLSGIGGELRPGIVHRLDRDTSGLLVVAKDDRAHRALAEQFAARTVQKEYRAVVLGVPRAAEGTIATPIGRDPANRKRMSTRAARARAASTSYSVLERFDGAALLAVRIHSGRTHQIRVHLASIGHPVAGDLVYGGRRTPPSRRASVRAVLHDFPRPALHAARLAFHHPTDGRLLAFESDLPADLAELLRALRIASS